ncbi:MAG: hypothetical protein ACYC4L_09945 [Chloroflexota bacterium]
MEKRRRVVLYGTSLVLASIGKSLEKYAHLEIVSADAGAPLSPARLVALEPDVLLLDLGGVGLEAALTVSRERPNLVVIGLDPAGERLLVLSGWRAGTLTSADLVKLIETGGLPARRPRSAARQAPVGDDSPAARAS